MFNEAKHTAQKRSAPSHPPNSPIQTPPSTNASSQFTHSHSSCHRLTWAPRAFPHHHINTPPPSQPKYQFDNSQRPVILANFSQDRCLNSFSFLAFFSLHSQLSLSSFFLYLLRHGHFQVLRRRPHRRSLPLGRRRLRSGPVTVVGTGAFSRCRSGGIRLKLGCDDRSFGCTVNARHLQALNPMSPYLSLADFVPRFRAKQINIIRLYTDLSLLF